MSTHWALVEKGMDGRVSQMWVTPVFGVKVRVEVVDYLNPSDTPASLYYYHY